MPVTGYQFGYTTTADSLPTGFAIGGITEDVARGIRAGLRKVTTITDITVQRITETRDDVAGADPA
jgi:hypothetical protein